MNLKWRDIAFQNKILLLCCVIIGLTVILIVGYMIPRVKESIINTKKGSLEDIVNMAIHEVDQIHSEYKSGTISYEDASRLAITRVKNIRYGREWKDYLWINDFQPKMIMHPFTPELEGKDLGQYKDSHGKLLFAEFVQVCRTNGSGFVTYMWQWKDQKDLIVPKVSFVKAYNPFGWIIGTGMYVRDFEAQVREELKSLYISIAIGITVITAAMFLLIYLFGRSVKRQIGLNISFAERLASGDLTGRVLLDQKDEFGQLAKSLNESVDKFENLISNIILSSQNLVQAIQEISTGNADLSQRTTEQASSLEEIASSVEETSASVSQNAGNSAYADGISKKAISLAEEGGSVMDKAVVSIINVNDDSRRIEEIISVINDIAFQTNLLALNAAVEAARAGDMGRGFAVVAGEVRNLAQRSGNAAKEIGDLIRSTIEKINQGTDLSRKSGEALKDIILSVKDVGRNIAEIAVSSEEQKLGLSQIAEALSELDSMTQQNAGLVEQTSSASEEIASQSRELLSMVEQFKVSGMRPGS
jgi:methyl-accepting chemotaxis protein